MVKMILSQSDKPIDLIYRDYFAAIAFLKELSSSYDLLSAIDDANGEGDN